MAQIQYWTSRGLIIHIEPNGTLVANASMSRPSVPLSAEHLLLLQAFKAAKGPEQAFDEVASRMSREQFNQNVTELVQVDILVPVANGGVDATQFIPAGGLWTDLIAHYEMLRDNVRVNSYKAAIFQNVRGKVVAEIGAGTGILSILAAQAGAKHVYAIEETELGELAQEMFKANKVDDRTTLVRGNSLNVTLPEKVDVILHELINVDPFSENLITSIRDGQRFFRNPKEGRFLPYRMQAACMGLTLRDTPSEGSRILRDVENLDGFYGVDFTPFRERVRAARRDLGASFFLRGEYSMVPPKGILTEECVLRDINLQEDMSRALDDSPVPGVMRATDAGVLGAVVIYFKAWLDERHVLSGSPFAPVTCWGFMVKELEHTLPVKPGDEVRITSRLRTTARSQRMEVSLA
jgi:protein arginine N-methyltransferase 1